MDLIAKSGESDDGEERPVSGLGSAGIKDAQRETIIQKGLNCLPAVERGYINWDHKEGPGMLLGYPTRMELVKAEEHPKLQELVRAGKLNGLCMWVEGKLWKAGKHSGADEAWQLMEAMKGGPRRLAWSVQGRVLERNGQLITKSEINQIALTHQPILQVSFADIAKSFSSETPAGVMTTSSASPLMLENLDGQLAGHIWGTCTENHYDNKGRFWKGHLGTLEHMTHCRGHQLEESKNLLKAIITSGIGR